MQSAAAGHEGSVGSRTKAVAYIAELMTGMHVCASMCLPAGSMLRLSTIVEGELAVIQGHTCIAQREDPERDAKSSL